jgi:uncharacterized small protein (DUF1192 family)
MIRRAVASSFERLADALSPKPQSQEQEEERAMLVARVTELEAERDKANNTRIAAETMMREARENLRLSYARVDELEAEREWKPWPPEVRDGRRIVFCCPARGWCCVTVASTDVKYSHPCFYRELGPLPGDGHA